MINLAAVPNRRPAITAVLFLAAEARSSCSEHSDQPANWTWSLWGLACVCVCVRDRLNGKSAHPHMSVPLILYTLRGTQYSKSTECDPAVRARLARRSVPVSASRSSSSEGRKLPARTHTHTHTHTLKAKRENCQQIFCPAFGCSYTRRVVKKKKCGFLRLVGSRASVRATPERHVFNIGVQHVRCL